MLNCSQQTDWKTEKKTNKQVMDDHTASKVIDIKHKRHDLCPLQTGQSVRIQLIYISKEWKEGTLKAKA